MLELHWPEGERMSICRRQVDGLRDVQSRSTMRRLQVPGPVCFGRGLEVSLTFDEACFEGAGVFLFGGVLEYFLGRYVSLNSFTETVIKTQQRGEIMRWSARTGQKEIL
jgi:type VI secretion system protein ImpG